MTPVDLAQDSIGILPALYDLIVRLDSLQHLAAGWACFIALLTAANTFALWVLVGWLWTHPTSAGRSPL